LNEEFYHEPVLLEKTTQYLLGIENETALSTDSKVSRVYVDCTLGGGGYTKKILEASPAGSKVIAIDRDENAIAHSRKVLEEFKDRVLFVKTNFSDIKNAAISCGYEKVSGIVMDLGLSTYQLSNEDGFSYQRDTELDMRAGREQDFTAKDVLNTYSEKEIARILFEYGEMRYSRQLAKEIVIRRKEKKFSTTFDLVKLMEEKVPPRYLNSDLSRMFQAIRIEVNGELVNLEKVLKDGTEILEEAGRIVAVSYHSLEDRIVKNEFRANEDLKVLTKKPLEAEEGEIEKNIRARSAKLRAAEKRSKQK
jgi:16S rRNA (cytosine1402-N4)-methyltransferase